MTREIGDTMPSEAIARPGYPCPGFIAEPGRCWQMIHSEQLQATHCRETPR